MAHVLFSVWTRFCAKKPAQQALIAFKTSLDGLEETLGFKEFAVLYTQAMTGSFALQYVARALLRDFKASTAVSDVMFPAFRVILSLGPHRWSMYSQFKGIQRKLLCASLAACRSVLCLVDDMDPRWRHSIFSTEIFLLM